MIFVIKLVIVFAFSTLYPNSPYQLQLNTPKHVLQEMSHYSKCYWHEIWGVWCSQIFLNIKGKE